MSEYQLQIKQVVDYPRCRIYRQFVQSLMADRSIRIGGGSGLFYCVGHDPVEHASVRNINHPLCGCAVFVIQWPKRQTV